MIDAGDWKRRAFFATQKGAEVFIANVLDRRGWYCKKLPNQVGFVVFYD